MLDYYAIGVAAYPFTMADYYTMQETMHTTTHATPDTTPADTEETVNLDYESPETA